MENPALISCTQLQKCKCTCETSRQTQICLKAVPKICPYFFMYTLQKFFSAIRVSQGYKSSLLDVLKNRTVACSIPKCCRVDGHSCNKTKHQNKTYIKANKLSLQDAFKHLVKAVLPKVIFTVKLVSLQKYRYKENTNFPNHKISQSQQSARISQMFVIYQAAQVTLK